MARQWTPEQLAAMEERGRTLLVSAAAGSGKTATLTERVIRSLTDPQHPADISRMLIVTFTRAAAAELRDRIAAALREAVTTQPERAAALSRQLLLLPSAHVSTIDSFCLDLCRRYAGRLGLSPAFRLADPAEDRLLMLSVMERLIEACYAGSLPEIGTAESFCRLADCLVQARTEKDLATQLLGIYQRMEGFVRSYRLAEEAAAEMEEAAARPPFASRWGAYLQQKTIDELTYLRQRCQDHMAALRQDEIGCATYLPTLAEDDAALEALCATCRSGDYEDLRQKLEGLQLASLKSVPAKDKTDAMQAAQDLRQKEIKPALARLKARFSYTAEEWAAFLPRHATLVRLLGRVLATFDRQMREERQRRAVCDFASLERGALELLCDAQDQPTPLAAEVRAAFDYVYIDEYQDVNEIQHRLFSLLSNGRNCFMVGDVKQSIYSFRGAQPDIFASLRRSLPALIDAEDAQAATLSLACNFRSKACVLDFANLVFGRLMEATGERIGYTAADALVPGVPEVAAVGNTRVRFTLFSRPEDATEEDDPDGEEAGPEEEAEAEEPDEEARATAAQIAHLIQKGRLSDGTPVQPGDIAILTRRVATGTRFVRALAERGIRAETSTKKGFFLNPEILLALSLLNVIDDPRRDIPLAGVLRSPIYGLTMDDLIALRQHASQQGARGCTLYEALTAYVQAHPDFAPGVQFLKQLADFRQMAEGQPVDRLIREVYRQTGLLSLAGADKTGSPALRRANLMTLYDYARRYEGSSFHGLYAFITYINEVLSRDQSIDQSHVLERRPDTVQVMTIHQSKGLEFPICFLCDTGTAFNLQDAKASLLFDGAMGCAMRMGDESGFARFGNPLYTALASTIRERAIEEEMRVLYVALTRPKEQLYISATVKDAPALLRTAQERARHFGATAAYACRSHLEMLLAAAGDDPSYDLILPTQEQPSAPPEDGATAATAETVPPADAPHPTFDDAQLAALAHILEGRFRYEYPDERLTRLPRKLSVSRLYPALLDEEEEGDTGLFSPCAAPPDAEENDALATHAPRARLPRFMGGEQDSAAEAGTATHLFLQFCDFTRLHDLGGAAELERLVQESFLEKQDADRVRLDEIERFRHSALLRLLLTPGTKLHRELRFHVHMPAAAFAQQKDTRTLYQKDEVLVQGVMDGVATLPDGRLILFDYKTDRLTARELRTPSLAAKRLCARHQEQLSYYAYACRAMFGRLPDHVWIYSLALGDTVEVPVTLPDAPR